MTSRAERDPLDRFARVPVWVALHGNLKAQDLRLAILLYAYSSKKNYRAWPSVERLATQLHVSRSAVGRSKTRLMLVGILCFQRDAKKGNVHSLWLAVKKPFDFVVDTSTPEFVEYRKFVTKRTVVMRPAAPHWKTEAMRHGSPHTMRHGSPHQSRDYSSKNPSKQIGFLSQASVQQTIRTDQQQMVRHTNGAQGREEEPETEKSSMLDGQVQGGGDGGARRAPPPPPTGRRADAPPSVSLDDFAETPKKRKGRALKDGTPGQKLLDAFCVAWREKLGVPYTPSWGRDLKMAKEMATNYPADLLPAMLRLYLSEKDPYVNKEKFPFSLFRHRVNLYAANARRESKGRSGYKAEVTPIGKRVFVEETEHAVTHRVFTENGWEFEVVKKEKPKAEKPIMDAGEEFD